MMTTEQQTLIDVQELTVHYGPKLVLDKVSFAVPENEITVIIGGSGCGKSTLLKAMTGLIKPTSGRILYRDEDITVMEEDDLSAMQRRIGIAFQSSGLINSMSVGDNVALPLREYGGMNDRLIDATVRLKLGLVGLESARELLPAELSGGMKKRAGLARAIALDPPVVYFDEPSAGLDPIMAAGLDELILDMKELLGITVIIVTHELQSIENVADRVLMLDKGGVIFYGTVEEAHNTDVERTRQFFERRPDAAIAQRNV